MEKTLIYSLEELDTAQALVLELLKESHIFTFSGPLGAGKTTLIKKLLKDLGVTDIITSPTYNYVNIYTDSLGNKIYHFDLYRISGIEEFFDLGFNEYLSELNSYSFIEWPEIIQPLLKSNVCEIKIDYEGTDKRVLKYHVLKK